MRALHVALVAVLAALVVLVCEPGGSSYHRHDVIKPVRVHHLVARLDKAARG